MPLSPRISAIALWQTSPLLGINGIQPRQQQPRQQLDVEEKYSAAIRQ